MKYATKISKGCLVALIISSSVSARDLPSYSDIAQNRSALIDWLATNQSGEEFYAESEPSEDGTKTNIALIVDGVDIEEATNALSGPGAWCELMILHLNVKTCLHGGPEGKQWIRLYMGRKFYEHPKKAEEIQMDFSSGVTDDGVSWVELSADEGPYGTSDYYIGLFAIGAEGGSYVQITSSQKVGRAAASAMNLYFNTLGRSKIGFSVVGTHRDGKPEYSTGSQAALERNVVRYLLAVRVYMPTRDTTGLDGLRTRAGPWFDASEKYAEQLHEVDRDDYLRDKEKEYLNQLEMQAEITGH